MHALLKRCEPADAEAIEGAVRRVWEERTGADRVELRELRTPAGAVAYLAIHHHKLEQQPPHAWRGRTLRPSRNYFDQPSPALRERVRGMLADERLVHVVAQQVAYREMLEAGVEEEADAILDAALARARDVQAAGVRVVRIRDSDGAIVDFRSGEMIGEDRYDPQGGAVLVDARTGQIGPAQFPGDYSGDVDDEAW